MLRGAARCAVAVDVLAPMVVVFHSDGHGHVQLVDPGNNAEGREGVGTVGTVGQRTRTLATVWVSMFENEFPFFNIFFRRLGPSCQSIPMKGARTSDGRDWMVKAKLHLVKEK